MEVKSVDPVSFEIRRPSRENVELGDLVINIAPKSSKLFERDPRTLSPIEIEAELDGLNDPDYGQKAFIVTDVMSTYVVGTDNEGMMAEVPYRRAIILKKDGNYLVGDSVIGTLKRKKS